MTPDIADRLLSYSAGPKAADRLMMDARSEIRVLRSEVTDLQATIASLTRELGEARRIIQKDALRLAKARDAEAADIVAWLRNGKHELSYVGAAAGNGQGMYWPGDFADSIARHEHRKELSHD